MSCFSNSKNVRSPAKYQAAGMRQRSLGGATGGGECGGFATEDSGEQPASVTAVGGVTGDSGRSDSGGSDGAIITGSIVTGSIIIRVSLSVSVGDVMIGSVDSVDSVGAAVGCCCCCCCCCWRGRPVLVFRDFRDFPVEGETTSDGSAFRLLAESCRTSAGGSTTTTGSQFCAADAAAAAATCRRAARRC